MVVITRYAIRHDRDRDVYVVRSSEARPPCPGCGYPLRAFGHRIRHAVDGAGVSRMYELQRLRCDRCRAVHLELPDFMAARKYYDRDTIQSAILGEADDCPAEDSTIRRWKKESRSDLQPVLPTSGAPSVVDFTGTDTKEE